MDYFILAVSILCSLSVGIINKKVSAGFRNPGLMFYGFNAVSAVACVLFFLVAGGFGQCSTFTVLTGCVFGIVTAIQQIFFLRSLRVGPYSYTMIIITLSMVIPAFSGAIIWGEPLSLLKYVGVALMAVCIFCSVESKNREPQGKTSVRWLIYVIVTFFLTGAIGVLQKWHQTTVGDAETNSFLVVAFAFSFLFSVVAFSVTAAAAKTPVAEWKCDVSPKFLLLGLIGGACAGANNLFNLQLSGRMDSVIFFPTVNGGLLILSLIASLVLFREKPTVRQWVGIAFGVLAVAVLCVPVDIGI